MQISDKNSTISGNNNAQKIQTIFQNIGRKINDLFQPEEVEVIITGKGPNMSYTYTKVETKNGK